MDGHPLASMFLFFFFFALTGRGAPCPCSCPRALGWWSPPTVFFLARSVGGLTHAHAPGSPMPMPMPVRPRVAARGYLPLPSSFLLEEGGRSRLVATPFCPPIFSFFCVRGGAGLPMFMRSKFGLVATPPCPLFFPALRSGGGAGLLSLMPMPTAMPVAAPCPACYTAPGPTLAPHVHAMPMRSGWWPPPSCPLFSFEGRGFFSGRRGRARLVAPPPL